VATAGAVVGIGKRFGLDLPISEVVDRLCSGQSDSQTALAELLSRPLKEE